MKQWINADRFRHWMMIVLLAVVALGSFWVLEVMRRDAEEGNSRTGARTDPDYYVEQFNYVRLSNTGKSNYHITGERMNHRPQEDDFEIIHPKVNSFDDDKTPVTMTAERAIIEQKNTPNKPVRDSDEVHLYGNVNVERAAGTDSAYMKLQTEYLMLQPDLDLLKTDKAVTINMENVEIHAVGMEANNATQEIHLLSQGRGVFSRPSAKARPSH
jgi:lipopolysaccharide export system protein LptC